MSVMHRLFIASIEIYLEEFRPSLSVCYNWEQFGAVHKVRHARGGEGVREGVTVCDRGGGQEHVTSRLYKFLSYI